MLSSKHKVRELAIHFSPKDFRVKPAWETFREWRGPGKNMYFVGPRIF